MNFLDLGFILTEEYKYFFVNLGRGGTVRGWGEEDCPNHRGEVGPGHMFIVRGGFESPMIWSRSASLPSLQNNWKRLVFLNVMYNTKNLSIQDRAVHMKEEKKGG